MLSVWKNGKINSPLQFNNFNTMKQKQHDRISINEMAKQIKQVAKEVSVSAPDAKSMEELGTLFPDSVYKRLPSSIRRIVDCYETPHERSVALMISLIMMGIIMTNYHFDYDSRLYSSAMYGYVCAGPSSGKGIVDKLLPLILPIDEYMRASNGDGEKKCLLFPGDVTTAYVVNSMSYGGPRLLSETESDILKTSFDQKHGNLLAIIRKMWEHELSGKASMSFLDKHIKNPVFATTLASTLNQLYSFMPQSGDDGTFSRFLLLFLPTDYKFRNGYHRKSSNLPKTLQEIAPRLLELFKYLEGRADNPVMFTLTEIQDKIFDRKFTAFKNACEEKDDAVMAAVANRRAIDLQKLLLVLSMIRLFDEQAPGKPIEIPDRIVCDNRDFATGFRMICTFHRNAEYALDLLQPKKKAVVNGSFAKAQQRQDNVELALKLHNEGMKQAQIARIMGVERSTIHKWLNAHSTDRVA